MATQPKPFLTPEQYLEFERESEERNEYLDGEIFAMSGGSPRHNTIVNNIASSLRPQIRKRCQYFTTDLRVFIPSTGLYTYPDLMVICGQLEFSGNRQDTVTNPSVIVEVLSPSTQTYDRGNKFVHYRSLPTLKDYITVAQNETQVEHSTLQSDGSWLMRAHTSPEDILRLTSIGAELRLADCYEQP